MPGKTTGNAVNYPAMRTTGTIRPTARSGGWKSIQGIGNDTGRSIRNPLTETGINRESVIG